MDSLSLSATLLNVLTLVQKSAKLISAATRLQDPKLNQVYYRLLAEKKRTEEWASHIRVLNCTKLCATMPLADYNAIVVHFRKMDTCYKKAQEKFSAVENARKGPVDPTAMKAGTKSLPHGYDDLKEFVDTLAALNNVSRSIASPLQSRSPNHHDRSPIRSSPPVTTDHVSLAANSPSASDAMAQHVDEGVSVYEPTAKGSIHSVYQATLDALATLSVRRRDPQIAQCASRLKIWGAGLFKMSIPLDVVFESDKDGSQLLRMCIVKAMVMMLVWEEQEFGILASEADNEERFHDQHYAHAITTLLGSHELIDLAIESWRNLLEVQADNGINSTASRTGGDLIPKLIQMLFDLSPALRAARQTYCIRLAETRAHQETIAEDQADTLTAPPAHLPPSDDVESKLDAVGEILSKPDQVGAKKGKYVKLCSRIFRRG